MKAATPLRLKCGKACASVKAAFYAGTVVTLEAKAAEGSSFEGWSGACSGTGTCVVTMSAAKSVTATFSGESKPTIPLTIEKAARSTGSGTVMGGGISCGANCISATVGITEGREIILTAKPAWNGSTFAGWTGCDSEPEGKCLVRMSAAKEVTAKFK